MNHPFLLHLLVEVQLIIEQVLHLIPIEKEPSMIDYVHIDGEN